MMTRSRRLQVVSKLAVAMLVAACICGGQVIAEPLPLPMGTAVVDGVLDEWEGANWIAMDKVYHGDPSDLSNAQWAAMWAPDMIYVAVRGVDNVHVFNDTNVSWNAQDSVEIYVDSANKNVSGYSSTFSDAQQYVGSPSASQPDEEWLTLPLTTGPLDALGTGIVPAFEAVVDGQTIRYEIAIRPYSALNINHPESSTVLTLSPGMTLGLDVVMDTKYGDQGDDFGMLCENMATGKFGNADLFLDHITVPEPSTFVLLLASAACLIFCLRRRHGRGK